jgi:hypothetical protein
MTDGARWANSRRPRATTPDDGLRPHLTASSWPLAAEMFPASQLRTRISLSARAPALASPMALFRALPAQR